VITYYGKVESSKHETLRDKRSYSNRLKQFVSWCYP